MHADPPPAAEPDSPVVEPAGGVVVTGRVLLVSGEAAAGARVRAWDIERLWNREDALLAEETCGTAGDVTVRVPGSVRRFAAYASLPGTQTSGIVLAFDQGAAPEFTITLGHGGVLTGNVYAADGSALSGVEVRLVPLDRASHGRDAADRRLWALADEVFEFYVPLATTDAEGAYRFEGAPLPRDGKAEPRAAVVRDASGRSWRSDDVAFSAHGEHLVRDVQIGRTPWEDVAPDDDAGSNLLERVAGRVVSAATREPVRARIVYAVLSPDGEACGGGPRAAGDGRFEIHATEGFRVRPEQRVELRVKAPGHLTWRGVAVEGETIVPLEPVTAGRDYGRIRGLVTGHDGRPLSGVFRVVLADDVLDSHERCVFADASGTFALEGVDPGHWRVHLVGTRRWIDVSVPEGGESAVELTQTAPPAGAAPRAGGIERQLQEAQAEVMSLHVRREELASESGIAAADREALRLEIDTDLEEAHARLQRLARDEQASRPRRPLVVRGLPGGVALLRAEGPESWCVAVVGAEATFPSLSVGRWKLVPVRRGAAEVREEAMEVTAGDGPQIVEFADPDGR